MILGFEGIVPSTGLTVMVELLAEISPVFGLSLRLKLAGFGLFADPKIDQRLVSNRQIVLPKLI
jgi:hypothetical protein